MIEGTDYHVELIHFPIGSVRETVTLNEDDTYTIFIEASLDKSAQQEAFLHAMKHITGRDFTKADVQNIEHDAHSLEFSMELCY